MPSSPLDTTHSQTTSSVAFHYRLWAAHTVELRQAWHAIIAFGKHKKMNDVGRGMKTSPLGSTHGQTTSAWHASIAFGQHIVERRRAWHDITFFGQRTRSNDVGRGMPSSSLGSINGRKTSGVACHLAFEKHTWSNDVGRGMTSPPLDGTHGQTTPGVA